MLGVPAEISISYADPILERVTDHGTCLPKFPLLIVAANLEVVEGRKKQPFAGKLGRHLDKGTYDLFDQGKLMGKACTYFVNAEMATILHRLPAEERLCDLRYIRTSADLRLAVIASISEPTYFPSVPEPDPKQLESVYGTVEKRTYLGGFVMNSAVQDVKRAAPDAWVVGTGRTTYSRVQNQIIKNWFTIPMNEALLDQRWWLDAQIPVSQEVWSGLYEKDATAPVQAKRGYDAAKECFYRADCLNKLSTRPHFFRDVKGRSMEQMRGRGITAILRP
jgi:hypothetical protein